MKKLLLITDNYAPRIDGIARFLIELIPYLKKHFEVKVLAPDFGEYHGIIPHIKIPLFNVFVGDFQVAKPKRKIIKKAVKDADLVFVQTIGTIGYFGIKYAKKYKKPLVAFKHSLEWELVPYAVNRPFFYRLLNSVIRTFSKRIYNKCDIIMCPSKNIAEKLSWYNIKAKKVVVPVGVNASEFIPPKNKAAAKESIGINPELTVLGYHGRLAHEKGLKSLARVYRQIGRRKNNLMLLLLGEGVKEIKEFTQDKGAVIITGKKNVVPYLQAMDIYCMPSLTETSCLSLIEAMSCQLPVIATKTGMIPEYIKDEENGLLIEKNSTYFLYKQLKRLIEDKELRQKISINARKTVVKIFNWENTANKIIKILKQIV